MFHWPCYLCSPKYLVGFPVLVFMAFLPSRTTICFSATYSQFHENTSPELALSRCLMCSVTAHFVKPVLPGTLLFGTWGYWTSQFSDFRVKCWCFILAAFPMTLGIKMNLEVLPLQLLHLLHCFRSQPGIVTLQRKHTSLCYCSQLSHSQEQSEKPEEPQQKVQFATL